MVSAGFVLLGKHLQVSCPGDAADCVWGEFSVPWNNCAVPALPWSTLSCGKGVLINQPCDLIGPAWKWVDGDSNIPVCLHQFTWKMGGAHTGELPWVLVKFSSDWMQNSGLAGGLLEWSLGFKNTPNPSVLLFKSREFAGPPKITSLLWFWLNWVTKVQSRWCNKVEDFMLICTCCAFGPLQ